MAFHLRHRRVQMGSGGGLNMKVYKKTNSGLRLDWGDWRGAADVIPDLPAGRAPTRASAAPVMIDHRNCLSGVSPWDCVACRIIVRTGLFGNRDVSVLGLAPPARTLGRTGAGGDDAATRFPRRSSPMPPRGMPALRNRIVIGLAIGGLNLCKNHRAGYVYPPVSLPLARVSGNCQRNKIERVRAEKNPVFYRFERRRLELRFLGATKRRLRPPDGRSIVRSAAGRTTIFCRLCF